MWSAGGTSASVEEPARPLTAARNHTRPTGTACSRSPNRRSSARPSASNVSTPTPPRCAHRTQHRGHGAQRCRGRGPQPQHLQAFRSGTQSAGGECGLHPPATPPKPPNRHHPDEADQQHGVQCRRRAANPLLRAATGVGEAVRRIPGRTQPRGQRFAYKGQIVDRVPRRAQPLTDPRARRLGTAASVAPLIKSAPVRIQVPAIQVDSTLVGLGLQNDGTMQLPPTGFPPAGTPVHPLPVSWDRRSSPATSVSPGAPPETGSPDHGRRRDAWRESWTDRTTAVSTATPTRTARLITSLSPCQASAPY